MIFTESDHELLLTLPLIGYARVGAYSMAKAGVHSLTKTAGNRLFSNPDSVIYLTPPHSGGTSRPQHHRQCVRSRNSTDTLDDVRIRQRLWGRAVCCHQTCQLRSNPKVQIDQLIFQGFGLPGAKIAQPEDIASAVSYLASPAAHFITGEAHDPMLPTVCTDDHH